MKKNLLLLAICVCALTSARVRAEKIQLTLEKAKQIALEQNPTLAIARANMEAAAAAVQQAEAAYYPSVDVSGGISRLRDYPTARPVRDWDNTTQYRTGISMGWLLFDGGARHFRLSTAEIAEDTAISDCDDARRQLLQQVANAFYVVLQAQNSMEIALQDAEFNRQLESDAQKRQELGTSKLSEVLNFQYQVGSAEVNYIQAQRTWRNACVALGQLLVIQQDSIWDCIELVPPETDFVMNGDIGELNDLLAYAHAHRPDLIGAQNAVRSAEAAIGLAEAEWAPQISAFYDLYFQRNHSARFNRHHDRGISFGVQATWNLFNGFATEAAEKAAKARLEAAQKTLNSLELEVDARVREAYLVVESSRLALQKQNELLEIASRIRDLVKEEYDGGTATITRLNEVQTDLTNTALARSNAYVQVLISLEALGAATALNLNPPPAE
ncbi:MAG: TolC family protein [Victivallales bacterium]|nr:TolC family protein [Victivallales bacterium]